MSVLASATSVSRRRSLVIWGVCCALAAITFIIYLSLSQSAAAGAPVMPLDDAYIHFQYARQLAAGQPFVYNPGLPPTSGGTSFLYPFMLGAGVLIGFHDLALGLWALIVGALALAVSIGLIAHIGLAFGADSWLAVLIALAFGLNGAVGWHFMSGMETGLVIVFTLGLVFGLVRDRQRLTLVMAALLALTRPEGAVFALLAVFLVAHRRRRFLRPSTQSVTLLRAWLPLTLPLAAIAIQPLINRLVTGSSVASGNAAKSVFGMVPFDLGVIIGRIFENFVAMWAGLLDLRLNAEIVYLGAPAVVLAVIGYVALLAAHRWRAIALSVLAGFLVLTAAISTLDTAFWHFRRYQMPLYALMFVLAVAGAAALARGRLAVVSALLVAALLLLSAGTAVQFAGRYALNVGYVLAQPLAMARWLAANAPLESLVAVHDVGMMRFAGERTTLDIVGLTTPGAADYWRNGPGAVGEFIVRERPNLIAAYGDGHGYGLGYLEATDLYAETLVRFTVELDPVNNVALAASSQGIHQPVWAAADAAGDAPMLRVATDYLCCDREQVGMINVAEIASERSHHYQWTADGPLGGFPTEFNQFRYLGCAGAGCEVMEGGRRIGGVEAFDLPARPGVDAILVTRLHPAHGGTFDVFVDDAFVATRIVPALPGSWLDVPTLIPGDRIGERSRVRIVPALSGDYMPYRHSVFQGANDLAAPLEVLDAQFQDGAIGLSIRAIVFDAEDATLTIEIVWSSDGSAQGDYQLFVHLLNADGAIAAQLDQRPGSGNLPPGNWLPGRVFDRLSLDLAGVPAGRYALAFGLYNPVTFERLLPASPALTVDEAARLILGEVEVVTDG
ncbi:MAG: hypothetical protein SNJ59_06020 [Aggregatilineales bacterium]